MWGPGSAAFLLPLFWIGVEFLFGRSSAARGNRESREAGGCHAFAAFGDRDGPSGTCRAAKA